MYTFKCSVCLRSFPTSSRLLAKDESAKCSKCKKLLKRKKKEQVNTEKTEKKKLQKELPKREKEIHVLKKKLQKKLRKREKEIDVLKKEVHVLKEEIHVLKKKKKRSTDNSLKNLLKTFYGKLQSISTNGTKKYFNKHKLRNNYYAATWIITESQPLHLLEGFNKRGWKDYHLDHIVPISYGYKNDIPPVLIGSLQNLQFISSEKNLQKRDTLTKKGNQLLLEWRRKSLL